MLTPAGVSIPTLRRWTLNARRRIRLGGRIAVTVVPPRLSQSLNTTYRGKKKPTNVLSFDYAHQGSHKITDHPIDGEVLLCPAVIRKEAKEQGRTYMEYFHFLLNHGLIHLLDLDHKTAAEQKRWNRYEQRLQ